MTRVGEERENLGGLTHKALLMPCQDIQYYMEHISESSSQLCSCLTVSLPISVISFDILHNLFFVAHQGGMFYYIVHTLFES